MAKQFNSQAAAGRLLSGFIADCGEGTSLLLILRSIPSAFQNR
jgi:hypothetical protein